MQTISKSSKADKKGALKVGQVFCSVLYTAHLIYTAHLHGKHISNQLGTGRYMFCTLSQGSQPWLFKHYTGCPDLREAWIIWVGPI